MADIRKVSNEKASSHFSLGPTLRPLPGLRSGREVASPLSPDQPAHPVNSFPCRALLWLFLVSILISIPSIVLRPAWHDEIYTLRLTEESIPGILHTLEDDSGPPLYYIASHIWSAFAGSSIQSIRILSFLASLGFLAVFVSITHRAPLWLAVHPIVAAYAVEARNYGLLLLFMMIALAAMERSRPWIALAAMIGALYTHNIALFLLPAWVIAYPRRAYLPVAAFLAYLPWWPTMMAQPRVSILWMADYAKGQSLLSLLLTPPGILAGGLFPGSFATGIPNLAAAGLAICLISILLIPTVRNRRHLLFGALGAAGSLTVYSILSAPLYFPGRTEIILLPLLLSVAVSTSKRSKRELACLIGLTVLGLIITLTASIREIRHTPAGQALAAWMAPHLSSGDIVIFTGTERLETTYYLSKSGIDITDHQHPLESDSHPGWLELRGLSPPAWMEQNDRLLASVSTWSTQGHRVFILLDEQLPAMTFPGSLRPRLQVVDRRDGRVLTQFVPSSLEGSS
ncbi:MAG TPA: hypothetical protein PKV10_06230 [Thermoanaerobaculia bacterium]|nr:hypothetical protein [Thermoanaerobaculia bacterium]